MVVDWLKAQGISVAERGKTDSFGTSNNVVIERQRNVLKTMENIEKAFQGYPTPFVDNKLIDYLSLKHAFAVTAKIKKLKPADNARKPLYAELIDLKCRQIEENAHSQHINSVQKRGDLEKLFGLPDKSSVGASDKTRKQLLKSANNLCEKFLSKVQSNPSGVTDNFKQYIAGVIDGDGSFQVNFQTTPSSFYCIPLFSITDGIVDTQKHYVLELFITLFNLAEDVTDLKNIKGIISAGRSYARTPQSLKKLIEFVNITKIVIPKNQRRFLVLEEVVQNVDRVYKDRSFALSIIDSIDEGFESVQRDKATLDRYRESIKAYFNNKK